MASRSVANLSTLLANSEHCEEEKLAFAAQL